MKSFVFSTIILGFVLVCLIINIALITLAMYKMANAKEYVIDSTTKVVTTDGTSATAFWGSNKTLLMIPTVANVLSMVLVTLLVVIN